MENKPITVNAIISDKIFRDFAVFDNLYRLKRWLSPVIFAAILSVSACVCFVIGKMAASAVMLGCVLLLTGWGLPAVYLLTFFGSVKAQIKAYKLDEPRLVYSLFFSHQPDGIRITNPSGESARYEWDVLYGAYRINGCAYLYVAGSKAFLLPDSQVDGGADALWSLFADMLPPEKLHDLRKKK